MQGFLDSSSDRWECLCSRAFLRACQHADHSPAALKRLARPAGAQWCCWWSCAAGSSAGISVVLSIAAWVWGIGAGVCVSEEGFSFSWHLELKLSLAGVPILRKIILFQGSSSCFGTNAISRLVVLPQQADHKPDKLPDHLYRSVFSQCYCTHQLASEEPLTKFSRLEPRANKQTLFCTRWVQKMFICFIAWCYYLVSTADLWVAQY